MIEIVCPSCGARYQVPEDSIGPEGRKVTCSSCSHRWRAYAESAAAAPEDTVAEADAGAAVEDISAAEPTAEAGEEFETAGAAAEGAQAAPHPGVADSGRQEQMDSIRRMLEDLKRSAEADEPGPEPATLPTPPPVPPTPMVRKQEVVEAEEGDPLRSKIDRMDNAARSLKGTPAATNYDAVKLRRKHEKRAKRLQRARDRRKRSGAFLTGFTLVAGVAATMVGLYVMHPQIIAASPEVEPAMNEYVVTVDRYRIQLDEATAGWQAWVSERIGKLTGEGGEEKAPPS